MFQDVPMETFPSQKMFHLLGQKEIWQVRTKELKNSIKLKNLQGKKEIERNQIQIRIRTHCIMLCRGSWNTPVENRRCCTLQTAVVMRIPSGKPLATITKKNHTALQKAIESLQKCSPAKSQLLANNSDNFEIEKLKQRHLLWKRLIILIPTSVISNISTEVRLFNTSFGHFSVDKM